MLSPFSHWTHTAYRLGLVAALVATLAAVGGSLRFVRVPPESQPEKESLPLGPGRRSDFWGKPKPWCLDCHRQGDHRIDPLKRTAYAQLTLGELAPVADPLPFERTALAELVAEGSLGPAQR